MRASRHSTVARVAQPATRVDTTCWQLFRPDINTAHFYFFCCRSYVKLLDCWRAEKIFSTSVGPPRRGLRPVAFATSATGLIRHWIVRSGWLCAVEGGKLTRYHLVKDKKTWNDANEYCKQNQMSLVVIANQQEQIQLQAFLKRQWLCHTYYPRESFREGLWNHRHAFVSLSVCLSVCLFVCHHDN